VTTESGWARFFNAHAAVYMKNCFTRNTLAEVDFLVLHLKLRPGMQILDVGCGTGRHSVELARRGFDVTGIDLSEAMLAEAHKAAESAGAACRFIQCDVASWQADRSYDAVICLCEGAFGLLGQDEDPIERDLSILRRIAGALVSDGRFMLTTLNAARAIRACDAPGFQGSFDPRTLVLTATCDAANPNCPTLATVRERHYTATELELMCRVAGLTVDHIGGGTAGQWALRPLKLDEMELMLLAHK
jgi:SAM-dependent methyltransferase